MRGGRMRNGADGSARRGWAGRGGVALLLFLAPFAAARAQFDAPAVTPRDAVPPVATPSSPAVRPGVSLPGASGGGGPAGLDRDAPVTFTADAVEYDRDRGVVSARGKVEAWQGERVLRADEFTYNRNTGVATARGNVQLLEPDGQVLFADSVELKDRFRDGVLSGVRALLAANGRLAANGAQRTGGTVNELSRAVYSSCDLCPDDPTAPPLWQLQARRAVQDKNEGRISYRDATLRFGGVPAFYAPYFSHPDPSSPRASGFLFPTLGITRFLGAFVETPYFWAIDNSADLTIVPLFSSRQYPNLGLELRKVFNFGQITADASIGSLSGKDTEGSTGGGQEIAGHIFARGRFTIDEHWRAGFDINRASSETYLRTFRYEYRRVLTSQAYVEGFWGTEGFARFDSRAYQGLRNTDDTRQLPYVLPNLFYEYAPRTPVLGGQVTADVGALGIWRDIGSATRRLATRVTWTRPEIGPVGDVWTFRVQGDALGYSSYGQQEPPTNLPDANGTRGVGNIRAAIDWRMPLVRSAGAWGSQTIEPRVQFVTGPRQGPQSRIPNEDSIDFEFTDANLFALNRFTGRDRQEGGSRVDYALRAAWDFPNGGGVEGLVGGSRRFSDNSFNPYPGSGLEGRQSDYVTRLRVAPVSWFETIGRVRVDDQNLLERRLVDTVANLSLGRVTLSAGYLWSPPLPYLQPSRKRDEVGAGFTARIGENWRIAVSGKYDLGIDRPVLIQGAVGYEDECFIIEGRFIKRFAEDPATQNLYPANTVVLFRVGFKTLGDYFFRAI
jgi:LPS-assembly protein